MVEFSTDISEESSSRFLLYPNPTQSNVVVHIQKLQPEMKVKLFDSYGRVVLEVDVTSPIVTLNMAAYSSGVYYIQLLNTGSVSVSKIIKQ